MKILKGILLNLIIAGAFTSCSSDDETLPTSGKDTEKPTISVNYANGFPQACAQLKRGETYTFKALAKDNMQLASFSIDLHHNFDHHTHDNQNVQCALDPIRDSSNPFIYMKNFTISGGKEYEAIVQITIPANADTGDYHCSYSVVDETGWQGRTSVDIKIID